VIRSQEEEGNPEVSSRGSSRAVRAGDTQYIYAACQTNWLCLVPPASARKKKQKQVLEDSARRLVESSLAGPRPQLLRTHMITISPTAAVASARARHPLKTSNARRLGVVLSCPGRGAASPAVGARGSRPAHIPRASNGAGDGGVEDVEDKKNVWALDFDGVVCDSCGESALSAWKAATELWPDVFTTPDAMAKKERVVEDMRTVRPVVETGYENIVQVRCLLEGVTPADMLDNWSTMLPEYMAKWDLDRSSLVELFGRTRDDWIAADLDGWLAPNRIYPGVAEAMDQLMVEHEVYIVTTKQARFTEMILERMAFIDFPGDRIYSQTVSGRPKSEVLQMLQERHPGTRYHFVEDKYSTLKKVEKESTLDAWNLYLVDWGYNVQSERDEATASGRINMVDIAQFRSVIDAF